MKAKDYLALIDKRERMIKNKLVEIEQWEGRALHITSVFGGERVQSSGNPQKMEAAVVRCREIKDEIAGQIEELRRQQKKALQMVESLNAIEYDVLHRIYVQYYTLEEVATVHNKTYSWATTVHGRALKHVQEMLDGGSHEEGMGKA